MSRSFRLVIGINFNVLCCLGRCEENPLHIVGTIDRMDMCDIITNKVLESLVQISLEKNRRSD